MTVSDPHSGNGSALTPARLAAAGIIAAAIAAGAALFIEHGLNVKPCELCLLQRIPYYIGVPLGAAAAVLAARRPFARITAYGLAAVALIFVVGAGMGVYHAGVEWGLWQGPTACTGAAAKPAGMGDFLKQLDTVRVVRCDEVSFRIFGQSLAVWNALTSAGVAALLGLGALRAWRGAQG